MQKLRRLWRSVFDVRPGEYMRVSLMSLYLMLVLFSYYVIKPAAMSLFLNRFSISQLPFLTIVVALVGGVLAYWYTKLIVRTSLSRAVTFASFFSIAMLLFIWWLLRFRFGWTIYLLNIWLNLFSIVLVSQGWLVAANVFSSREAKRLYTLLGLGAMVGAAFGGKFTSILVHYLSTDDLLPVSAGLVLISYFAYWAVAAKSPRSLSQAKAGGDAENFAFKDIVSAIGRYPHLQVIIGIITITFVINEVVDFQFSAFAKQNFKGEQLTAFLGDFFGVYLNLLSFILQIFVTGFVVNRFGVGGTLQIMPVVMSLSSLTILLAPGMRAMSIARLAEASTRYSIQRTGMELLYLPLPLELKNRTKAFVDIFADRMARALGGVSLVIFVSWLNVAPRLLSIFTIMLTAVWLFLTIRAKREYIATVQKRLEARRLDLDEARISVTDFETIALLEQTAQSELPRQASYALAMLGETPRYELEPLLDQLSQSPHPEVRAKVFELAQTRRYQALLTRAMTELRGAREGVTSATLKPVTCYTLETSDDAVVLAKRLLDHPNQLIVEGVLEWLSARPEVARELITLDWLESAATDPNPRRRSKAALALSARGDQGTELLHRLLQDAETSVRAAAIRAAGKLQNRAYLGLLLQYLSDPRLRGAAIDALGDFGVRILGSLGDLLDDPTTPLAIRRHIPRVLRTIQDPRSIDILLRELAQPDLTLRAAVLAALNRLRERAPQLNYGGESVREHILEESRYYFDMHAALMPFLSSKDRKTAAGLLAASLRERLRKSLDRLFRLFGLLYPPREIYAAYLALSRGREDDEYAAALEFLDNVIHRDLKGYVLPLFEDDIQIAMHGEELFKVQEKGAPEALREIMRTGDPWLVSCAVATAAEKNLTELREEIESLAPKAGREVAPVVDAALGVLRTERAEMA